MNASLSRQRLPGGQRNINGPGHLSGRFADVAAIGNHIQVTNKSMVFKTGIASFSTGFREAVEEYGTGDFSISGIRDRESIGRVHGHSIDIRFQSYGAIGTAIFHPMPETFTDTLHLLIDPISPFRAAKGAFNIHGC